MAKKATFNLDEMALENGMLTGIVITDSFTATSKGDTKDIDCPKVWTVNLPIEVVIDKFWAGAKVSMRSASFKKMSAEEIEGMNAESYECADYLTAKPVDRKKVSELAAQISGMEKKMMLKFYEKAMVEAIAELGEGAETVAITNLTQQIFDESYAPLIKEALAD